MQDHVSEHLLRWEDIASENRYRSLLIPGNLIRCFAVAALLPVGALSVFMAVPRGVRVEIDDKISMPVVLAGVVGALLYFIVLFAYRKTRQRQQFRMNESLVKEAPRNFVLYLRSFRRSGYVVVPNHLENVVDRRLMGNFWDVELALSRILSEKLMTLAIGAAPGSLGAAKLTSDDRSWQRLFAKLAVEARVIFIVPDDRPGTLWELRYVLSDSTLRRKTIVLMPPEQRGWKFFFSRMPSVAESWEAVRKALGNDIRLPKYCAAGAFLQLDKSGSEFIQTNCVNFHPVQVRKIVASAYTEGAEDSDIKPKALTTVTDSKAKTIASLSNSYDEGWNSYLDPVWPIVIMCTLSVLDTFAPAGGGSENMGTLLFASSIGALASVLVNCYAFTLTGRPDDIRPDPSNDSTPFSYAPGTVRNSIEAFSWITLVLIIRSFIAEPFKIPSSSMVPSLMIGDLILVNKFSYGIRLPFVRGPIIDVSNPQRGDVMVFKFPKDPSLDYIKRVIGVPGDNVTYKNKRLIINGEEISYQSLPDYLDEEHLNYSKQYLEDLSGVTHKILNDERAPSYVQNPDPFPMHEACSYDLEGFTCTVPAGHYFMMGNNRDNSLDSRYWGFVPDQYVVGKAVFVWMNFGNLKRIGRIQ